jgi:dihydroorotate dehydrogenase (fumarate)
LNNTTDLSTTYLGMHLDNPLIVGSCGLTSSVDRIREFADHGAAAIVLKSLFEEQIQAELSANLAGYNADYPGASDYIAEYTRGNEIDTYLELIREVKKSVNIPVIASINCVSAAEWVSFARSIEKQGADALELNVSLLPSNPKVTSEQNEKRYAEIINAVGDIVSIPLALKMSPYSASLAGLIQRLSWNGKVGAFVLFNRYYTPDIDIDQLTVKSAEVFSSPAEGCGPLRWMALLSGMIDQDLAASTGIHDAEGVIKQLLAGATAVQLVSTLYRNGPEQLGRIIDGIGRWMEQKNFTSVSEFRGRLSYDRLEDPEVFERTQFMKYFAGLT